MQFKAGLKHEYDPRIKLMWDMKISHALSCPSIMYALHIDRSLDVVVVVDSFIILSN